ncbi:MAG: hypothetical protein V3V10_10655, partial [Planctomycetota bacterium]
MLLLHKGFDALDVAFPGQISKSLTAFLDSKKAEAQENGIPVLASMNGLQFHVAPSGASGGYAFICNTGKTGEIWKLKRPSPSGEWGIFASVSAVRVALQGLPIVRTHLIDTLNKFGVAYTEGSERINRVDFALDFLMPDFVLSEDNFVMGHRFARSKQGMIGEPYRQDGKSNRVTGITIGKNPGRQIVIYDKRLQIMTIRDKMFWLEIWNCNREKMGLPALDLTDPDTSRVWRIELRLYKNILKSKRYRISSFGTLESKLAFMFRELLRDVRYVVPTNDSNRSRWLNHTIWDRVQSELKSELASQHADLPMGRVLEIQRAEKAQMLNRQVAGCVVALAGLYEVRPTQFLEYAQETLNGIMAFYESHPTETERKLKLALSRFA